MVGWGSCVVSISTTCGHMTSDRGVWWLGEPPVWDQSPPPVDVWPQTEVSDGWMRLLCSINLHHLWMYNLRQRWVMVGWESCVGSISTTCRHMTSDRGEWWLGGAPVWGQSPPPVDIQPQTEVSNRLSWVVSIFITSGHMTSDRGEWWLGESPMWHQSPPPVDVWPQTEVSGGLGGAPVWHQSPPPVDVWPQTEVSCVLSEVHVWGQFPSPVDVKPQTEVSEYGTRWGFLVRLTSFVTTKTKGCVNSLCH